MKETQTTKPKNNRRKRRKRNQPSRATYAIKSLIPQKTVDVLERLKRK